MLRRNNPKAAAGGLYLTIDDGPSENFERLIDFLSERDIPALFFNRGDFMELRPEAVIYGIRKGFLMGNHAYSHRRFSSLDFEGCCIEIMRTDEILERLYDKSDTKRTGKYFRFPYMDRGMGAALIEPEELASLSSAQRQAYHALLEVGLGHKAPAPDGIKPQNIQHKRRLQDFLRAQGYRPLPVHDVSAPYYAQSEMSGTIDSLCSFSTCDWALTKRHKGRRGFQGIEDLKALIDHDENLRTNSGNHIILAHDQEDLYDTLTALIDHFLSAGFKFCAL